MYKRIANWIISIRAFGQRRDVWVKATEAETPQDTYRRAKAKAEKIRLQTGNRATVDLISTNIAFKPKGNRPHKSWYWCPYCNQWRVFLWDDSLGVNCCNICGISDADFYVRKYNNLFMKDLTGRKKKL